MRYRAIILAVLLIAAILCSCGTKESKDQILFYYCSAKPDYSSGAELIKSETHTAYVDPTNYKAILAQYLQGPRDPDLTSPFPGGCEIVDITLDQATARITMSKSFSTLTGVELTLACACLSLTTRAITGYATVEISAVDALLDNKEAITIDANNILLTDQPA